MNRRLLALAATAASLAPRPTAAQARFDAAIGSALQSLNSPALGTSESQSTLAGGAAAGLDFLAGRAYAGYGLDAGSYASPGDWSYRLHRLDARYRVDLSASTRLHFGSAAALRRNGAGWQDADYDAIGGFVNLETKPAARLTLRTGYRLDRRTFDSLPSLDQTEHAVFASLLANLPSRTTLIAEASGGLKGYRGDPALPADPGADEHVPAQTGEGGGASGRGRGGPGAPGTGGMGPSSRPTLPSATGGNADRAGQFTLLLRVAQSLGERTGLSLQGSWRGTGGSVPPALVTTPAGLFDDGVYDDPFASGLVAAQLRLKHVRPGGGAVEAGLRRFRQAYTAALALGADGLPLGGDSLREDQVWRADASAEVPLFPSRSGVFDLRLQLGYAYTQSRSNDAFYDYRNHAGGITLAVSY
jgi:hypothetical protein